MLLQLIFILVQESIRISQSIAERKSTRTARSLDMFRRKVNRYCRDVRRRERIIDTACGILILPGLYVLIIAVMAM